MPGILATPPTTPKERTPVRRVWLAAPLLVGAVVSLTLGVLARSVAALRPPAPTYHLFFSDVLHFKVWLSTAALALGLGQVVTASRIYGVLRAHRQGRVYQVVHRWSGWLAIGLTLPVAYHCLFLLGVHAIDARILTHAALGCFFYGVFAGKLILVHGRRYPGWALPIAGSLLFTALLGLWLASALWFFSIYGVAR
jgi:hypothetical protein